MKTTILSTIEDLEFEYSGLEPPKKTMFAKGKHKRHFQTHSNRRYLCYWQIYLWGDRNSYDLLKRINTRIQHFIKNTCRIDGQSKMTIGVLNMRNSPVEKYVKQ